MRISSSPLPPAIIPAPTFSADPPHSASTKATPEAPQHPLSMERTNATGGTIKAGNSSQKTSLSKAAFLDLPNEMVLQIVGDTGPNGEGIDLNLRPVSKGMQVIADKQLSPKQRFRIEYGPTLHATAGYDAHAMRDLARLTPAQQNFALTNGQMLHATAGYNGTSINGLATLTPAQQSFVLTHGPRLHTSDGYDSHDINRLAVRQR